MVRLTEDSVCKVEKTVGESGEAIGDDCCGFRIGRIVECTGLVTDCVSVGVSNGDTREVVEVVEDDKEFETVVRENVEVFSVEDDAVESVNEAVGLQPREESVEVIEDGKKSETVVIENVEVLSVEDDAVKSVIEAVILQPRDESVEVTEDGKKSQTVVLENVEVLSVEDDALELVNEAVVLQPREEIVEVVEDDKKPETVVIENVKVLSTENNATESINEVEHKLDLEAEATSCDGGEQTQFEVQEPVIDQPALSFPATFVSLDLGIQFGSFGTEQERFANINSPKPSLIDLQENDKNVNIEGVDDKHDGQGVCQRVGVSVHVQTDEVELPLYRFLVKNPGYEDERLNALIQNAELQLDEKRRCKDEITDEINIKWENLLVHKEAFHVKKLQLRAARQLVNSKRQQIDYAERVINKLKNYTAVEDIDSRISKAEHVIKHGTLSLEDEKQFIHEIKQLKAMRVQLASNMGSPDEIHRMLDRKDQLEELVKNLNMELKTVKDEVSKAQVASHTIRKKYHEELEMGRELRAQFIAAEESRKEASTHLHGLRKQLNDKVERFMGKWNTNEESRKDNISQCNTLATQNTQDEPSCMFPSDSDPKVASESVPTPDETEPTLAVANIETQEAVTSVDQEQQSDDQFKDNVLEEVEEMMITKEPIEANEIIEIKEEEKTDELVKEEIEAKLKEKSLLEEKMKANEANKRKKQNAEKGPSRAEIKAQLEAQKQERRRLRRLKKREKKRAAQERKRAARDAANTSIDDGVDAESNKSTEVENTNTAVDVALRKQKPWRHWGSMVITVVILLLSIFSLLQ